MKKMFPYSSIRNIRLYYILSALTNAWFIAGNWIFYWTRFMTYGQLGVVDATAFSFGLLMEIPSGAVSDLFGKKKTIAMGMFLAAVGGIAMAFTNGLVMLWIAFLVMQLGWAFYSGSAEALAYDSLKEHGETEGYDQVASVSSAIASVAAVVATLLGGLLYTIQFRLSHLVWGLTYFVAFLYALKLIEPKIDTIKFSFKGYWAQLLEGTKQIAKKSLRPFIIVIFALLGADYIYEWGLVKPTIARNFGFLDKDQAIIFALFTAIGAVIVRFIPVMRRKISDKKGLYLLTFLMGFGFALAFLPLGYFGLIPMLIIQVVGYLANPWVSVVVNDEIPSELRATALSAVALLVKIPYVFVAIIAGDMAQNGTFNVFNLYVGIAIMVSILLSSAFLLRKKFSFTRG